MKTIRRGDSGNDVKAWQKIVGVSIDGIFGPVTQAATVTWQRSKNLVPDGVVGPATWGAASGASPSANFATVSALGFPFVVARNYSKADRRQSSLVVLHTAEAPEGPKTAANVASFFALQPPHGALDPRWCRVDPKTGQLVPWQGASGHYMVDALSTVQNVEEKDIAWHAGPVNGYSIGVEHAGYAKQTAAEWMDPYSRALLERSAWLVGDICRRHGIPVRRVTAEDLRMGVRTGICGHVDVSKGLGGTNHTDPGPHFVWDWFLSRVKAHARPLVRVSHAGKNYLVAPTYLSPVGIGEAKTIAASRGSVIPTPGLVDAIWKAADLKIPPPTQSPNLGEDAAQFAQQADDVWKSIGGQTFHLLGGSHKDIVEVAGSLGLYGWHQQSGVVIQPPFTGHSLAYRDYSHGLRLIYEA